MIKNLFTLLIGVTLLILGFMFSVVILAIIAVLGITAWGYLWWKTRKLRRAMRTQAPDGQIIDGEAIVVEEDREDTKNSLPNDPPRQ
ncbi:MAG: hypothetical protein Q7J21_04305 [Rugosibacter sp.]|nr:hypothetical protein [Rugosibacter sp.]